ncbi:hypothetical protein WN943_007003 [Citrus x changshan-huyou]
MPLSSNTAIALPTLPIPVSSIPRPQVNCRIEIFSGQRIVTFSPYRRKRNCLANSVSSDGNNSINVDIPFPSDYSELLDQAKMAAELAVKDGRKLMVTYYWIIEELYAHIDCRISDGEGGIEMTGSMRLIREFCDLFVTPEKVTRTRIVSLLELSTICAVVFLLISFEMSYQATEIPSSSLPLPQPSPPHPHVVIHSQMLQGLQNLLSTREPERRPVCAVIDVIMGWTADVFKIFEVPIVGLFTSGACSAAVECAMWQARI